MAWSPGRSAPHVRTDAKLVSSPVSISSFTSWLDVHDPADVVLIVLLDDQQPGVAGGDRVAQRFADGGCDVHRHDAAGIGVITWRASCS